MKSTLTTLGVSFAFLLVCALSMGNRMYLLLALLIVIAWILAYISIRTAEKSVRVSHGLNNTRVNRGESVAMQVSVSHRSLLPIAPVKLKMRATSNTPAGVLHLTELGRRTQKVAYQFAADHIGAMIPGVESFTVSDVFGFFKKEHVPDNSTGELLVLPVPFEVEPLTFAPGDMGVETMKRAMEDPSSPSDFRAYQNGDPLKRIHWKMSARKQEIMIRQFEEPALPDALVLMDTSPPRLPEGMEEGKLAKPEGRGTGNRGVGRQLSDQPGKSQSGCRLSATGRWNTWVRWGFQFCWRSLPAARSTRRRSSSA